MSTLATDLRGVFARHIQGATPIELLRIAERLLDEQPRPATPKRLPIAKGRFLRLDADREEVHDAAIDRWLVTWDRETDLVWTHALACGQVEHAKALEAAAAVRLFGSSAWLASEIRQTLTIIDYERCDPAVDPAYFRGPYDWLWTRTVAAAPSGFAWLVDLDGGGSDRSHQSAQGRVRAVLAGQQLGLGI
jgi:hypothetical protein